MARKPESYTVTEDGFINGMFHAKGQTVDMTEAQAAFYGPRLKPVEPAAKPEPAKA